jgi:hypothetical protein
VSVQNIGQHIKKIFSDGELSPNSVIKNFFITAADGKDYDTNHYNLQMIIAVGFKVNNEKYRTASFKTGYSNPTSTNLSRNSARRFDRRDDIIFPYG